MDGIYQHISNKQVRIKLFICDFWWLVSIICLLSWQLFKSIQSYHSKVWKQWFSDWGWCSGWDAGRGHTPGPDLEAGGLEFGGELEGGVEVRQLGGLPHWRLSNNLGQQTDVLNCQNELVYNWKLCKVFWGIDFGNKNIRKHRNIIEVDIFQFSLMEDSNKIFWHLLEWHLRKHKLFLSFL